MIKITIFENEYNSVKGAFEVSNLMNFNDKLVIKVFVSSQEADLTETVTSEVIFVDIDLSSKSELDGYALIKKLSEVDENILSKIVILTGNNQIEKSLKEKIKNHEKLKVIIKPTDYEEITNVINDIVQK